MSQITALIWLTHPAALNTAINDYQAGADVAAALYTDDTFNEYTDTEIETYYKLKSLRECAVRHKAI